MRILLIIIIVMAIMSGCIPLPPSPEKEPSLLPSEADEAIRLAKAHLAARLGISEKEIAVLSVVSVIWSDTSLGLPEPGMVYAQVLVPGFLIVLSAKSKEYIYHAGKSGVRMVVKPAP